MLASAGEVMADSQANDGGQQGLPGLDASSLILQAIAGLCSQNIPADKAWYIEDKVYPLVNSAVEFLLEHLPEDPEIELGIWMLQCARCPSGIVDRVKEWAGLKDPDEILDAHGNPIKSALVEARGVELSADSRTRRGSAAFVTPAGMHVSEETLRRVPPLLVEQKRSLVQGLAMFQDLSERELKATVKAFELSKYLEGEEVHKQGVACDGMHIVVRGEGRVMVSTEIGILKPGDVFGDREMMLGLPCNETVEASNGSLTTLHVSSLALKALGVKKKIVAMGRKRAHKVRDATCINTLLPPGELSKVKISRDEDVQFVKEGLLSNENLREVLHLTDQQIDMISREAIKKEFSSGEVVFRKGEAGDHFYIINEGIFEVSETTMFNELGTAQNNLRLKSGSSFGELCVIYNAPRAATVTCRKKGSVWMLSRSTLKNSVRSRLEGRMMEYAELISSVSMFNFLHSQANVDSISTICNALEERYFIEGEEVVTQGHLSDCFYIVFNGGCSVVTDGKETTTLRRGDHFGETSLLKQETNTFTVRVTSDNCTVLVMDRIAFNVLLKPTECGASVRPIEFASESQLASRLEAHVKGGANKGRPGSELIEMENLERVGILGRGAFGFVSLERDKVSGTLYALKAMSKGHIVQERLKAMVQNEKACLSLLDSPFIVHLVRAYRDAQHVYFLLEPCFGGELFDLYSESDEVFGQEQLALFYAANVATGLEHMHSRRVIYRDLKLENCLLTLSGYVKLTDLGIGKVCVGKTFTVCGTTDYFAPETLRQVGHNRAVDWWALGVLVYIMMTGRSPFDAPDTMKVYRKIMKGFAKVNFPAEFSEHCQSMIRALCQKNPEERLTMGTLGFRNFKDHPWYRGFNWKDLEKQTMQAPFVPDLSEEQVMKKAVGKHVEELPQIPYQDNPADDWDRCFDGAEPPGGDDGVADDPGALSGAEN